MKHSPKLKHYCCLTIRLLCVISRHLLERGLTPLQKCSRCILQPLLLTLWVRVDQEVMRMKRYSTFSPSHCLVSYPGHSLSWWEWGGLSPAKKQSIYFKAPADCATTTLGQCGHGSNGHKAVLRIPHSSIKLHSVVYWILTGEVLPFCRNTVGVFCSSSWMTFEMIYSIYRITLSALS